MRKQLLIPVLLLLLLLSSTGVTAQENVAKWLRYDVKLTVQENSGITVEEIQEVSLVGGATTFQRVIPTDKLGAISNVQVLELSSSGGQRGYQAADTQAEYTFEVLSTDEQQTIQFYFPPNNAASTRFVLRYFVTGKIRFYNEGDKLDWRPFGAKAAAPIASSEIRVILPSDVAQNLLEQSSTGFTTKNFVSDSDEVLFRALNVGAGDNLEVTLSFPHGVVQGSAPSWQQIIDIRPWLQWGSVILGVFVLLVGAGGALGWWYMKLRVRPKLSKKVPKYIKRPPSKLSPAVAGALLDGKSEPKHIMATLLDLAAKGVLNVYSHQDEDDDLFDDGKADPVFHLYGVDQDKAVQPYEATLYGKVFGYLGGRKRDLADVRQTVYMAVPEMKNQIDIEIAKAGYFAEDLSATRRQYAAFGGAGIIMGLILAVLLGLLFRNITWLVACPFLGIVGGAIMFIGIGFGKSKRTEIGETEAVRWQAFKNYIKDMTPKRAVKARQFFPRLLPYAMAFGLEKQFVEVFAKANTATPKWWDIPEEKLPDTDHEDAHAWVSGSVMSKSKPKAKRVKKHRTASVIRPLGVPDEDAEPEAVLKNIQPVFQAFLVAGLNVFAKAPPLEDDEIDFDSLSDDADGGDGSE